MKQELGPIQKTWLSMMRSGEYEQCTARLTRPTKDGVGYCCLGLVCLALGDIPQGGADHLSSDQRDRMGLFSVNGELRYEPGLISMNDGAKITFAQIADFIEANPEKVFREPK